MKLWVIALAAIAVAAVGCSGGDNYDSNYKTEVNLTPEQKKQAEANMAGQAAPGSAPSSGPQALTVPGKH
ncbi:MAG: hypothetical protein BGO01_06160 [Armatimonadetes bacterium 55-13]|nr:hypothetical protein [Armatimonadota bacterium]OJU61646.1 MAG: hypothetical protein BGO01_06160 [Armatimonadetes bacterium 55-13]